MALRLFTLLLPAMVLLGGAFAALMPVATLPSAHQNTVAALPYLLALITGFLGCSFRRSRILFIAINLAAAYFLIQTYLQTSLARPDAYVLFTAISLLLPLNIALIAIYGERGVFTLPGLLRIGVVSLGYALLYILLQAQQLPYLLPELPASMLEMVAEDTYLSEAAAIVFLLALIPVMASLILRKTHTDAGLLASLVAALVMILWFDRPLISSLFVSAALISLAISVVQNSYNMAFIDELTGIPARRALRNKLATLGRQYSIAMMDIDHFKKFNDTYGHDIGDQVLRMVAAKINQVRGGGKAYRYGGEEFTVVFPGKTEQQALAYLEEVREIIANYPMAIRSEQRPDDHKEGKRLRDNHRGTEVVSVTISIGVAEKQESHEDADAVIKSADQALYQAKEAGRNCSVTSQQEPETRKRPRSAAGAPKDFARQG
ncbi:GGDEF domain-containing protein [Marinobacterium jannaschii]|uniref:GGDEF domain-containing protein n=1 Tax=Marinobacterium jannaschii TaxID=64970 RepID=UPI00068755D7|nr:GGDEF domain-containing protein [Marinobacterium jannaschii]